MDKTREVTRSQGAALRGQGAPHTASRGQGVDTSGLARPRSGLTRPRTPRRGNTRSHAASRDQGAATRGITRPRAAKERPGAASRSQRRPHAASRGRGLTLVGHHTIITETFCSILFTMTRLWHWKTKSKVHENKSGFNSTPVFSPMPLPLTGLHKLHRKKFDKKNHKSPGIQTHDHLNTSIIVIIKKN